MGFPHSSVGKESACNAGDPNSIPGSGRSAREGIGNPLQYSWASLMTQLVKNLPAMRETWVRSLGLIPGLGRSLGEGTSYPLQYSGLEDSMDTVYGVAKSQTWLSDFHFHFHGDLHLNAFSHSLISFLLTILWGALDGSIIQRQLFNLNNAPLVSLSACMHVCVCIYIYIYIHTQYIYVIFIYKYI